MSKKTAEEREKKQAEEKKLKDIAAEKAYLEKQKEACENEIRVSIL